MNKDKNIDYSKRIVTIPNLLSLFRLLLIPVIVWTYFGRRDLLMTSLVLILSGITDLVDGWVARHFHMVSDLGKMLDPVADKLTQMAMLACLVDRYRFMLVPLVLLVIKEIFAAVTGIISIYKTKVVLGAVWHGKVTTAALYSMMIIHLVWLNIPAVVSNVIIGLCVAIMLLSFVLYGIRNVRMIVTGMPNHESGRRGGPGIHIEY